MEDERHIPTLGESLENSGEIVAQSPTLKTLLVAFSASFDAALSGSPAPFGNVITTWLLAKANEIDKRRLEEQFVLLLEQLNTLEGQAVRWDFFDTEEGRDMLFKVLDEARRTRSRLKKDIFARILKGAVLDFENREYSSEEYLYLISDLTEQEIRVVLSLYDEQIPITLRDEERVAAWNSWTEKAETQVGMDIVDLRFALSRLVSSGLLDNVTSFEDDDGRLHTFIWDESEGVGIYRITPGLEKPIRFMKREK